MEYWQRPTLLQSTGPDNSRIGHPAWSLRAMPRPVPSARNRLETDSPSLWDGGVSTLVDLFPPFGLHVQAGPLELRGLTDELILELCDLAEKGIHDPAEMPFYFPWTA